MHSFQLSRTECGHQLCMLKVHERLLKVGKCSSRITANAVCRRAFQQEMVVSSCLAIVSNVHCPLPLPQTLLGHLNAIGVAELKVRALSLGVPFLHAMAIYSV